MLLLKSIALLSLSVAFAGAQYYFQDYDSSVNPHGLLERLRCKRDAEGCPTDDTIVHCCGGVRSHPEEIDHLKAAKRACEDETFGDKANDYRCGKKMASLRESVCLGDCLSKKFNLLDEHGRLKRDAVLNHTLAIVGDIEWKLKVVEEYVGGCLDEVAAIKDKDTRLGDCSYLLLKFHQCNWKKFVRGCPAELQINSQKCQAIRKALKCRTEGDRRR